MDPLVAEHFCLLEQDPSFQTSRQRNKEIAAQQFIVLGEVEKPGNSGDSSENKAKEFNTYKWSVLGDGREDSDLNAKSCTVHDPNFTISTCFDIF